MPDWAYKTTKTYTREHVKHVDLVGRYMMQTSTAVQHMAIKCSYFDRAATIDDVLEVYSGQHGRARVFCQTKKEADELVETKDIKQERHVLLGDIPQEKRKIVAKDATSVYLQLMWQRQVWTYQR